MAQQQSWEALKKKKKERKKEIKQPSERKPERGVWVEKKSPIFPHLRSVTLSAIVKMGRETEISKYLANKVIIITFLILLSPAFSWPILHNHKTNIFKEETTGHNTSNQVALWSLIIIV